MKNQFLYVLLVAGFAFSSAYASDCPGNYLNGDHIPREHDKWFWSLDMTNGVARIEKSGSAVTGKVEMFCAGGNWSAELTNMTHNFRYNCNGKLDGNQIVNATCTTSGGGIIDVTGTFSTR
jgi:hypothetical protein